MKAGFRTVAGALMVLLTAALLQAVTGAPAAAAAGPYQIKFEHSGKCIDLRYNNAFPGARVQQWTCARPQDPNFANQRWEFVWTSDGFAKIRKINTQLCLDPADHNTSNGVAIALHPCDNSLDWYGNLQHGGSADWYALRTRLAGRMCLDLPRSSTADGELMQQWGCVAGNANQHLTWW